MITRGRVKILRGYYKHFIATSGEVFKTVGSREVPIRPQIVRKSNKPFIQLNTKKVYLLDLMLDNFGIEYGPEDRIEFKVDRLTGYIPLKNIQVFKFADITDVDADQIRQYKCDTKAAASNFRCAEHVTPIQVLEVLRLYKFKCLYCSDIIMPHNWHLDHYIPVSRQGKNVFTNLVPACRECNIMKSNMHGHEFLARCRRIIDLNQVDKYNPNIGTKHLKSLHLNDAKTLHRA